MRYSAAALSQEDKYEVNLCKQFREKMQQTAELQRIQLKGVYGLTLLYCCTNSVSTNVHHVITRNIA